MMPENLKGKIHEIQPKYITGIFWDEDDQFSSKIIKKLLIDWGYDWLHVLADFLIVEKFEKKCCEKY